MAVDTRMVIKVLSDLMQLDMDAANASEQAIENLDYAPIRHRLTEFKNDPAGSTVGRGPPVRCVTAQACERGARRVR